MNIYLIGLPKSGRSTVSKALAKECNFEYIDASSWLISTFRDPKEGEHPQRFQDEFCAYQSGRLKTNPDLISNDVLEIIATAQRVSNQENFIIDGIVSPRDLISLFNYNKDYIIFVNRTNNESECRDHESIGVSVIRDYCFWLASASLLPKDRWIEFNFKIPGEPSDFVKTLGSKNTVYITKNIDKVIDLLNNLIKFSK